jgi:selenide,water dikinase
MDGYPLSRELVLVGGGHAHALVLRMWGMRPLAGVRLTLVSPDPVAAYTGMLPGHIAGHYPREALEIDLVRLCRFAGARLILGRAGALDRAARQIGVGDRRIAYDVASLDIGVSADLPEVPGFAAFAAPVRPLDGFAARWEAFLAGERAGSTEVVVLGGGLGGVELALAMAQRLRSRGGRASVTIVEADRVLAASADAAARRLRSALAAAGIAAIEGTRASRIDAGAVHLEDGRVLPAGFVAAAAGGRPQGWLQASGLALTDGFVDVGPTLATSDPAVFAAGDCAHLTHAPRPRAGVFAVRAAPVLFHNLRAALAGGPPRGFRPQRAFLRLVSTGDRVAVADKWGLAVSGPWVWRWKDRIDRRFMARLSELPEMAVPQPGERLEAPEDPLCGGCGSKVGPGALASVLGALPQLARPDVLTGPGDDAAVVEFGATRQVITTDHLRGFWPDPGLMARIAAVHALGDVWAMGARPQAALAQLILPRMSERQQQAWLAEIMQAAAGVFAAEGAAIVGGHTTLGAELTLGFTVTGTAPAPVGQGGASPGDALILTKPLGSGTLLAAEMRRQARGRDVAACLATMALPQGPAARLLAGARAMTDVTGFGLAGHLLGLCRASAVAADLELAAIPVYAGAAELSVRGIRSTIFPANRAAAAPLTFHEPGSRTDLLFDPQTAGGLLAAVPAADADALVAAIRATGLPAARIGRITEGPPGIVVL